MNHARIQVALEDGRILKCSLPGIDFQKGTVSHEGKYCGDIVCWETWDDEEESFVGEHFLQVFQDFLEGGSVALKIRYKDQKTRHKLVGILLKKS